MPLPSRQANLGSYRYGFQNQETDPEMLGGAVAFKYRVHDARIGRFLSIDPLAPEYPWNSPYAFAENKVGLGRELEGLELAPFLLPTSSPLLGVSDVLLLEGSLGRTPFVRPVVEQVTKTNIERPTQGPWYNFLRYGSRVHEEQLGRWSEHGWEIEHWLGRVGGKGNRIDGLKIERLANGEKIGYLKELKPNSSWGRSAGYEQLGRYVKAAAEKFPDVTEWRPILEFYENEVGMSAGLFYTIQEGDNLSKIAESFGTTVENLAQLNNISNVDKIQVGEELLIDFSILNNSSVPEEDSTAPSDATYVRINFLKL